MQNNLQGQMKVVNLWKENQFLESLLSNFLVFRALVEMEWRNGGQNNELMVEGYDGDDEAESSDNDSEDDNDDGCFVDK